jgi:hypothetical protein
MEGRKDGRMEGKMEGWKERWKEGWKDGRKYGRMEGSCFGARRCMPFPLRISYISTPYAQNIQMHISEVFHMKS